MIPDEYNVEKLKIALERGWQSDLKFALKFAARIVGAVKRARDFEVLPENFSAFRARNDYKEIEDEETGTIHFYPLANSELGAPPPDKTQLGRFNAPKHPNLYLSTTHEVALAEVRALSSDTCTIANFRTIRSLKIATLLRHNKEPLSAILDEAPKVKALEGWLLARTADFVSRRVSDLNRDIHYRTCNFIASAFHEAGFDGLAFRTSYWSPGWSESRKPLEQDQARAANIVLFDTNAAIPKRSALYRINWKRPIAERTDSGFWESKS